MSRSLASPQAQRPPWRQIVVGAVVIAGLLALLNATGALAQVRSAIPWLSSSTPTYETSTVASGNVTVGVTATGPISAATSIPLSFKESGKLNTIKVNVGDHVTQGQALATLDTSDLQIALTQAKANLAQAQANLAKVQAGSTSQAVAVAQTSVNNAAQSVTDAKDSLASTQSTNTQDLRAAQASVTSAQTALKSSQDALVSTQNQANQALAADQLAITNAQKGLDATQATIAANQPVLLQQVQQAKDNLWSAQISRDSACGHGGGAQCDAANASVAASQTALNTSQSQLTYNQKQSDQQISTAQAAVDTAKAQLTKDQASQQASIVSAQNQVKQNEAAVQSSETALAQAQAKALASVQSAQSSVNSAVDSQRSAQASYNQTVAPPVATDIQTAQAQVQNAQAAVDQAQSNLDSAVLTAPFAGTIAAVNGSIGQWISGGTVAATSGSSASSTAVFTLMDLNNLQVAAQVNEADISKVKVGDPVTFQVSAFPGLNFQGKVLTIQPVGTTSSNVVVYNVTSSIQSTKDTTLYPGMTATVTIISAQSNNVLTVPNTALSYAPTAIRQGLVASPGSTSTTGSPSATGSTGAATRRTGSATAGRSGRGTATAGQTGSTQAATTNHAFVVTLTGDKLTLVPVTTGLTDGSVTAISSGLKPGDAVVTGSLSATTARSTGSATRSVLGGGPGGP